MHLFLGLMDLIQHSPVGKDSVEEVIGHPQKAINAYLNICINCHIGQFRFEAAQLGLQGLHGCLGLVQMAVFHQIRDETAANEIPGSPAFRTVQFR